MKSLAIRALFAVFGCASLYCISSSNARADDRGCQVILCLSNPGGPTQYAECVPPIQKLWSELAKGHSFPTCSGVGFQASRPGYQPYYCEAGYTLTTRFGVGGREASCVSSARQQVPSSQCYSHDDSGDASARWVRSAGRFQCEAYVTKRPIVRPQANYVDVTIDGVGSQRVWF